jgi:predicted nucleotidyltransferase
MTDKLEALPARTRERLDDLKKALVKSLGDDLVALVVHGSAVRGGFREKESDVDVIVVLKDDARAKLDVIANALTLARNSTRIECMILTDAEIPRAADVFPLLYQDIQRCHAIVHGKDPFLSLEIQKRHVRLRIEQELREAQIRMRRAVTDGLGNLEQLAGAVERKARQIRAPLRALLALRGTECDEDLATVLAKAKDAWGVDSAPLARVREDAAAAHAALAKLLAAAIADVDAREDA